jgi:hypothetical protein
MSRDIQKFPDRGKEKPSSQSQPRDFIKVQVQKRHETERLELGKQRYIMKGGMDRGKEKLASQSQKRHESEKLKLNKKHVIMKGGMERGETSNQSKTLEQQKYDAMHKVSDIADYKKDLAYSFARVHRDSGRYLRDIRNINAEYTNRLMSIQNWYEKSKRDETSNQEGSSNQ